MSWQNLYRFMEHMGIGHEPWLPFERKSHKIKETPPVDPSGFEISDFVLNQLRSVLGNRKPKRRRRRALQSS